MTVRLVAASAVVVSASIGWAGPARAEDDPVLEACLAAHVKGQELRLRGALQAARSELRRCAAASCPALVVSQCTTWLNEVDAEVPTVVVAVRDQHGQDRTDLRVLLDGSPLAASSLGRPVGVDPGAHRLEVDIGARTAARTSFVARHGERGRLITLRVRDETPARGTDLRLPAAVAGGVGVAGLVAFTVLALIARSEYDDLESTCGHGCAPSEVDSVRRIALAADVSLGIGALGLGVGGALLLASRSEPSATAAGYSFTTGWSF